jgi:hypothetical protein
MDVLMLDPKAAMSNPNLSPEVKYLLAEKEHTQNAMSSASAMGKALETGDMQTAALWSGHAVQENAHSRDAMMAGMTDTPEMKKAVGGGAALVSDPLLSGVEQTAEASRIKQTLYEMTSVPPIPQESPLASRSIQSDVGDVRNKVTDGSLVEASTTAAGYALYYKESGQSELSKAWDKVAKQLDVASGQEEPKLYDAWNSLKKIDDVAPKIEAREGFKETQNVYMQELAKIDIAGRQRIDDLMTQGDYTTATAECANKARLYHNLGNEQAATAFELAATQLNGLRTGGYQKGSETELALKEEVRQDMLTFAPFDASKSAVTNSEKLAASGQTYLKSAADNMEQLLAQKAKTKELGKGGTIRDELA